MRSTRASTASGSSQIPASVSKCSFTLRISFEAKQLTHDAYERLRTKQADEFEEMVLEAFQRKSAAEVPVPPGAADIPDYPERGTDAG